MFQHHIYKGEKEYQEICIKKEVRLNIEMMHDNQMQSYFHLCMMHLLRPEFLDGHFFQFQAKYV